MVTLNYALGQSSLPLSILGVTPGIIIATMMMKYCNKSVIATVYKNNRMMQSNVTDFNT